MLQVQFRNRRSKNSRVFSTIFIPSSTRFFLFPFPSFFFLLFTFSRSFARLYPKKRENSKRESLSHFLPRYFLRARRPSVLRLVDSFYFRILSAPLHLVRLKNIYRGERAPHQSPPHRRHVPRQACSPVARVHFARIRSRKSVHTYIYISRRVSNLRRARGPWKFLETTLFRFTCRATRSSSASSSRGWKLHTVGNSRVREFAYVPDVHCATL